MVGARARGPGIADINGAHLYYEVAGAGHPLVLIHAGIADSRMWDDQMDTFAERFTVIRYDVRGFGRSDGPPGSYSNRADLRGLLAFLGVRHAYLLGCSMGGSIAIDMTLETPDLVAALILVGAAVSGRKPSAALLEAWEQIDAKDHEGDTAGAVELELRMWVDGPRRRPDEVNAAVRERVREMNTAIFERSKTNTGVPEDLDPPALGRLGEIRVPTLVVVGDGDVPDVVESAEILASGIAGARKAVMQGVAHLPPMERPAEFNTLVTRFLDAL